MLYAPDTVLLERSGGKRLDPLTQGAVCLFLTPTADWSGFFGLRNVVVLLMGLKFTCDPFKN